MSLKMNLNLLVFCVVFFHGLIGILSENEFGESSDILLRQKRVVSLVPGEDLRRAIASLPYVVLIKVVRRQEHCPGTILTNHIVITALACVQLPNNAYRVHSGTSRLVLNGPYKTHAIMDKKIYHGVHPFRENDGISLLAVDPPFVFSSYTQNLMLFQGDIHPGTHATVSGWGCHEEEPFGTEHPEHLRSISVPIISVQECAEIYHRIFGITEADICTLDRSGQRYCGISDAGAPLVISVRGIPYLAGIHLWNGGVTGRLNPDVFVNLQDNWYKSWMQENIRNLERNMRNHNRRTHE